MISKYYKQFTIICGCIMLLMPISMVIYICVATSLNINKLVHLIVIISMLVVLGLDVSIFKVALRKWDAADIKEQEEFTQLIADKLKNYVGKKIRIEFKHVPGVTDPNEDRTLIGILRYGQVYDNDVFDYYVEREDGAKIGFNTNFVIYFEEVE